MKILITKTVQELEKVDTNHLNVYSSGSSDVESINIVVNYKGNEIANGKKNFIHNWVHLTMDTDNQDLEDYLVEGLENGTIKID